MSKKYVLGVDGGNTKTEYFLFEENGSFIDYIRAGTCSHEQMPDSFLGSKREINDKIELLCKKNNMCKDDIICSVFGLAGADFDFQKRELRKVISETDMKNFIVENDGYLALKAGSKSGCGVCSINGTGTVSVGINEKGRRLQVGGVGYTSGDFAGANYIADCGIAVVYNNLFRCGNKTLLKDIIFKEFNINDESEFIYKMLHEKRDVLKINLMMENAEKNGDIAVIEMIKKIGEELGKSVAGCINNLEFKAEVEVVLAGSVWAKSKFVNLFKSFKETVEQYCSNEIVYQKLTHPPAIGAIIWALEEIEIIKNKNDKLNVLNKIKSNCCFINNM